MRIGMMAACLAANLVAVAVGPAIADGPDGATPAPTAAATPAPDVAEDARDCLKQTGSHIRTPEGKCVLGPGRVITRDEIEKSGATSASDAIHRLTNY